MRTSRFWVSAGAWLVGALVAVGCSGSDQSLGNLPDGSAGSDDSGNPFGDGGEVGPETGVEGPGDADDFVGPFASWVNVKTDPKYGGAKGDGTTDDTDALQKAISHLADDGFPRVIYLPAGTYRITRALQAFGFNDARMVGEDPTKVTIVWDGPAGGDMMWVDGVNESKFERMTFDGNKKASNGIRQEVSQKHGNYSGMNLYLDMVFQNLEWGIHSPAALACGQADAENTVERCVFKNITSAGVEISSSNAFNWFVWHSRFEDCAIGVQSGPVTAAGVCKGNAYGEIFVHENAFFRSTNCDVKNVMSARGNYSYQSKAFQRHDPYVNRPIRNQQSFFRNVIVDPIDPVVIDFTAPIAFAVDNVIRSKAGVTGPVIKGKAHLVAVGNQLTTSGGIVAEGRVSDVDNTVVDRSTLAPPAPTPPAFAVRRDRKIFEPIPGGAGVGRKEVQAAIDAAVAWEKANRGSKPVVHLPAQGGIPGVSSLDVTDSLVVPADTDIQLIGDSHKTALTYQGDGAVPDHPVLEVVGPTKLRIQDVLIWSARPGAPALASAGIEIKNADQPGSRVLTEGCLMGGSDSSDQLGLLYEKLSHTLVSAQSAFSSTVHVIGGSSPGNGRVTLFGVANVTGWANGAGRAAYEVENGGALLVEDAYSESGFGKDGKLYMKYLHAKGAGARPGQISVSITTNAGNVPLTLATPQYDLEDFPGFVTFLAGTYWLGQPRVTSAGDGSGMAILAMGGQFPDAPSLPGATRALLTNRGKRDNGWSENQPDQKANVADEAAFIREALAFRRAQRPVASPVPALPAGVTDVRLSQVIFYYARKAQLYVH